MIACPLGRVPRLGVAEHARDTAPSRIEFGATQRKDDQCVEWC